MFIDAFMAWVHHAWGVYFNKPDPYVGVVTAIGALVTALALVYTAKAARAASKSTKVAQEALDHTMNNTRRDEFTRHFTLLLEQHNDQLEIVKDYLDSRDGKAFFESVRDSITLKQAHELMHGHSYISPYMRVLYHLLKYIDKAFYKPDALPGEKKGFSSLIRSLIRNDVLYLVALNSAFTNDLGELNQYAKYQKLLHEFSFFEHAQFYKTLANESVSVTKIFEDIKSKNSQDIMSTIERIIEGKSVGKSKIQFPLPLVVSSLYENPSHRFSEEYLFNLHNEFSVKYHHQKSILLKKLNDDLKIENFFKGFLDRHAILTTPEEKYEIYENNNLSSDKLEESPLVDKNYILEELKKYRELHYKSNENILFCKLNERGLPLVYFSYSFDEECRDYLKRNSHKKALEADEYWQQVEIIIAFWKSYEDEIASKRVS
ncbi:TPA: hypothetical protein G8M63_003602 [Salmonella enterica]|uniref:Phage abortive infection protein n=1 Tax=Salmonella enterica TaxID=28901 RepID=A0A747DU95_SALER|nr:hypothetical protein [Salmonella enterica]HAF4392203.1 hypothetical protein [Salmonella enterica]HAF6183494.1 hypothetical protein [Salmonella enterica]